MNAEAVQKIGGSCLATPEQMAEYLNFAAEKKGAVVLSALGRAPGEESKVTDLLIRLSEAVNGSVEPLFNSIRERHEEMAVTLGIEADLSAVWESLRAVMARTDLNADQRRDAFAGHGELASAALATAYLNAQGERAELVDTRDLFVTGESRSEALGAEIMIEETIENIRAEIRPLLEEGVIPVMPGFIGRDAAGRMTTIGRNGSDLTAAFVARALGMELHLLKDVAGVYDSDPQENPEARVIENIDMSDPALLISQVIDGRVAAVMRDAEVARVVVRNTSDNPGTVIEPVQATAQPDRMAVAV